MTAAFGVTRRASIRDVLELSVPIAFVIGALIGAGMVGAMLGWYLRDKIVRK